MSYLLFHIAFKFPDLRLARSTWQEFFMRVVSLPTTDSGLSYFRLASSIVCIMVIATVKTNVFINPYGFDTRVWDPDKASNDVSVPVARSLPEVKIKHSNWKKNCLLRRVAVMMTGLALCGVMHMVVVLVFVTQSGCWVSVTLSWSPFQFCTHGLFGNHYK